MPRSLTLARYCADCWEKQFVLRSLVVAVSKPLDLSWDELTDRLEVAWRQTTQLSNAIVTKLAMLDPLRTPEMTRMPAAPNPYLYPWAREEFPDLDGVLRSFPWFELETSLERRAEELGILFERATSGSPSTQPCNQT